MSQFTPAMETALAAETPLVVGLLKIELPDATIRLLDGSGQLVFDGETYTGRDRVFGSLAAVEAIEDGVGDEAPALNFTLLPASDAASAALARRPEWRRVGKECVSMRRFRGPPYHNKNKEI